MRVDAGVYAGVEVPLFYDPMIAKLVVWGADRAQAIERMRRALSVFVIGGELRTNLSFHRWLMDHPRFIKGDYDTNFIDAEYRPREAAAAEAADHERMAAIFLAAFAASQNHAGNGRPAPAPAAGPRPSAWRTFSRIDMLRR